MISGKETPGSLRHIGRSIFFNISLFSPSKCWAESEEVHQPCPTWHAGGKMYEINQISAGVSVSCHLPGGMTLTGNFCVLAMAVLPLDREFHPEKQNCWNCWSLGSCWNNLCCPRAREMCCCADLQPLLMEIIMNLMKPSSAGSTSGAKSYSKSHVWHVLSFVLWWWAAPPEAISGWCHSPSKQQCFLCESEIVAGSGAKGGTPPCRNKKDVF